MTGFKLNFLYAVHINDTNELQISINEDQIKIKHK